MNECFTKNNNGGFPGLTIGFSLILIHIVKIKVNGVSLNPARSIRPAVSADSEGICSGYFWLLRF